MVADLRILSARRAYEFAPDELRLTLLSNASFIDHFQETFSFAEAVIHHPPETFGAVPATMPPGLVFEHGVMELTEGNPTPIRRIHFEAQRLVIDIAGPSSSIDHIYSAIRQMLVDVRAPDGSPALGEPRRQVLDYSEMVARLNMGPAAMLSTAMCQLFVDASGHEAETGEWIAVPRWEMHVQPTDSEYGPSTVPPHRTFRLALRPGTRPSEQRFFSGAPLDTDAHLAMLGRLETLLGDDEVSGRSKKRISRRN